MTNFEKTVTLIGILILLFLLFMSAGCTSSQVRPEPEIRTVEVKVPVPVPCKALTELGEEPVAPDTDAALRDAPGATAMEKLFNRVKLLLQGRDIRSARIAQYRAAKGSCL